MDFIRMTIVLKEQTEQIPCENCNRANLIFKSAEYANEFKYMKGDIIVVEAVCGFCEVDSPVTVNVF